MTKANTNLNKKIHNFDQNSSHCYLCQKKFNIELTDERADQVNTPVTDTKIVRPQLDVARDTRSKIWPNKIRVKWRPSDV